MIARMVERRVLQIVLSRLDQFPAAALLGPHQVGKTTLAEEIGAERESVYWFSPRFGGAGAKPRIETASGVQRLGGT